MVNYNIKPEEYKNLLKDFDLIDIRVININFRVSPDKEPQDFKVTKLALEDERCSWSFPSDTVALSCSYGKFTASAKADDDGGEFIWLEYTILASFNQKKKLPDEFYKIFEENSIWNIVYPFIRELVTNIPQRAGYIFPPPPLRKR